MKLSAFLVEFLDFLRYRKKLWLLPLLLVIVLLTLLVILFESAAVVPFIYTLF